MAETPEEGARMIPSISVLRHFRPVAVVVLGLTGASLAGEPGTIGWTRHSPQVDAGTPRGFVEYENSCSVCHGPMPERPGTRALAAKYKGALPAMLEERKDLSPELIRMAVRNGITVMPQFRKTELSDGQLDAIVAYLTRPRS
jgi:mono/diheme cytochrome c family protein